MKKWLITIIAVLVTAISMSTAHAVDVFVDNVQLSNAKSVYFGDHAISVTRVNVDGTMTGNFLSLRGYDGIIVRTGGTGAFGTGTEALRIDSNGDLRMANAKSIIWEDNGISITRSNSAGDNVGTFLNVRGFDGIVMRTGGTGFFGTGNEAMRIIQGGNVGIGTTSPAQKLDVTGNIRLTGNIVSPNDICIGSC